MSVQEALMSSNYKMLAAELITLNEKQRRELFEPLMAQTDWQVVGREWIRNPANYYTRMVSLWGCGTARDIGRNSMGGYLMQPPVPEVAMILAARPDRTVEAVAKVILKRDWVSTRCFIYRDLILMGRVEHPDSPAYYEHMARAVATVGRVTYRDDPTVVATRQVHFLAENFDVLADLKAALSHEDAANVLAGFDSSPHLMELALREGLFARDELLDLCFRGQLSNFRTGTSAFFRKTLARLKPSVDELDRQQDQLVKILAAGNPSDQSAACKYLLSLIKAGRQVDGHGVAAAVATPLAGKQKAAAVTALKLLASVELDSDTRCRAAIDGLAHSHADVQDKALKILEAAAPLSVEIREQMLMWADLAAPAHRPRLDNLVGADVTDMWKALGGPEDVDIADLEQRLESAGKRTYPGTNLSELIGELKAGRLPGPLEFDVAAFAADQERLTPIETTEELVQVISRILVSKGDGIDLERAIDGLARFSPRQLSAVDASSLSALTPRDQWAQDGWSMYEVGVQLQEMTRLWLASKTPPEPPYVKRRQPGLLRRTPTGVTHDFVPGRQQGDNPRGVNFDNHAAPSGVHGFLDGRIWEAATLGVTGPRETLCFPTHVGGWIDAEIFDERVDEMARRNIRPGRFEAVQALMRLRYPEKVDISRAEFVTVFGDVQTDEGLSRALGHGVPKLVGPKLETRKHGRSPLAGELRGTRNEPRRDDPAGEIVLQVSGGGALNPWDSKLPLRIGTLTYAWSWIGIPRSLDAISMMLGWLMAADLDQNRSADDYHKFLAALTSAETPLSWSTNILLALALTEKNTVTSAAAVDLFVEAAADGRLNPQDVGRHLAMLTNAELSKAARFAKALSPVVGMSPLIAERAGQMICSWLSHIDAQPRDLGAVLETLELACSAAGRGVEGPARAQLEAASSGSSKRAKSAKRLLAIDDAGHAGKQAWAECAEALLARTGS